MTRPLAYLTDVEGRWDKIVDFTTDNPYVTLDAAGRIDVDPRALFVFGGDSVDRGPAGRRVVHALVEAKTRQPDRVVLLAGNRDINKLRLLRELTGNPPERAPKGLSRPELLRWIFANTMGAAEAFDMRQRELAGLAGTSVTDEEVVESFYADVCEGGVMLQYLVAAQLAYREGVTLFVHGSITDQSLGTVPGFEAHIDDAQLWMDALNRWYAEQVAAYRNAPQSPTAWEQLCAYQSPVPGTKGNQASVVYGRMLDDTQRPRLPSLAARQRLRAVGIERLIVGHTPMGDVPAILVEETGPAPFTLVMADNSYSRLERGSSVLCDEHGQLALAGRARLDDGSEASVRATWGEASTTPLGRIDAATGELVKGRTPDQRWHLFRYVSERAVEQVAVSSEELDARALVTPD